MKHYFVISPEMYEVIPILDDGTGPLEYFQCVAAIEAESKRDAKVLALRHPDMRDWVHGARGDDMNPLSGFTVEEASCPHGRCLCCGPDCDDCMNESEAVK